MQAARTQVISTDETRATLDGSDGWTDGRVHEGEQRHLRFKQHQRGRGVMIWAGIIGDQT